MFAASNTANARVVVNASSPRVSTRAARVSSVRPNARALEASRFRLEGLGQLYRRRIVARADADVEIEEEKAKFVPLVSTICIRSPPETMILPPGPKSIALGYLKPLTCTRSSNSRSTNQLSCACRSGSHASNGVRRNAMIVLSVLMVWKIECKK